MESERPVSEGAEKWLGPEKKIKCLNEGFVYLVDYMGNDDAVVQAARVSYGKGTKSVSEDRGLIRYLLRHKHTTPFEMVEFKFHCKLPIFVARQWIRHRTANVNEYSGRYSIMSNKFYIPDSGVLRKQSKTNKQGRAEAFTPEEEKRLLQVLEDGQKRAYEDYELLLAHDVARELARINLPVSNYTEWYWKIDLHNLFHFLKLRLDPHAQYEIRVYGEAIAKILKDAVPLCFEAFEDYSLNATQFSGPEREFIKLHEWPCSEDRIRPIIQEAFQGNKRETEEFIAKLKTFGDKFIIQ